MITALYVTKMESRKYVKDNVFTTIQINHNITLKTPKIIEKLTLFGGKNVMSIEYQMFISYLSPSIGEMMFEGSIDYFAEKSEPSVVIGEWENANSEIANKIKSEVSNNLMGTIIPFATMIAQRLELPSPLVIPRITFGKPSEKRIEEDTSYIG